MIRVAIPINAGWMGGINYYRNLLFAINQTPNLRIQVVILVGAKAPEYILDGLENFEVLKTKILDRFSFKWLLNKLIKKLTNRDYLLNNFLLKSRIEVLSHSSPDGDRRLKKISWIPDFQHKKIPTLFSRKELIRRDKEFSRTARDAAAIILSSENSYSDFLTYYAKYKNKARVLNFISVPNLDNIGDLTKLHDKYKINKKYIYLPNQFWKHKNHSIVFEAVSLAKRKNQNILVICTGECFDHRDPEYFKFILSELKRLDIESNVKIIGVVPYDDVLGLMKNSIAMINPSLFEGWSTTVEEAKSLNVKMLLSNINVHVEQAVNQAIFFSPYDPERLSELMLDIFNGQYRENLEIPKELLNKINMNRINEFARNYERIICDIYYEKII